MAKPGAKEQASSEGQPASSGLVEKMKDALSGLMAKMRPNGSSEKPAENHEGPQDGQKSGSEASSRKDAHDQEGARNESAQQQNLNSQQGQAQGQATERAQASQGPNSDQSTEKGSDAHSGIGRQDGDKAIRDAEQQQAMGKLEEIIGKRSANLTGDMMVETPSGKQQLKTAYSQKVGHHADLGGEINRDEIPLEYQQYVREYMEQVRKQGKSGQ